LPVISPPPSCQANKNVLLKGRLGADGVALLAAFKSWFQPSLALGVTAEYSFAGKGLRYGVTAQVRGGLGVAQAGP
jgi:hypothetical protein